MIQKIIDKIRNNQSLKNFIIYGFGQAFNLVTPLLIAPIIILICGLENYGSIGTNLALAFFLIVFVDYGCDLIGVREVALNRADTEKLKYIFFRTYLSKAVMLAIVLSISFIIIYVISNNNLQTSMYILSSTIVIGQWLNPIWFLQGIENFIMVSVLNIISRLVYLLLVIVFISVPDDFIYVNFYFGIGLILSSIFGLIYLKKYLRIELSDFKKNYAVYDNLKSGFSVFVSQIFVWLQMYSPIILVNILGGNLLAGYYRVVEQIVMVFRTYIVMFFNFVYPRFCYLLNDGRKSALSFWKKYNLLNFVFISVSMFFIFVFSEVVVSYFTNSSDTKYISEVLKVAVLLPIFIAIQNIFKQVLLGIGKQSLYSRVTISLVFLFVVASFFVIPTFGIVGFFWLMILIEAINSVWFYFIIRKDII